MCTSRPREACRNGQSCSKYYVGFGREVREIWRRRGDGKGVGNDEENMEKLDSQSRHQDVLNY